jgi:signal peptidase I
VILIIVVLVGIIMAIGVTVVITGIIMFRPYQISGKAMEPNFHDGEYVISKVFVPSQDKLKTGDVILFDSPKGTTQTYIKRVIGVPGDTIQIQNGQVLRNGQVVAEPYIIGVTLPFQFMSSNPIPSDTYYVLGDNREYSSDSREFGLVPAKTIKAKVLGCYFGCK